GWAWSPPVSTAGALDWHSYCRISRVELIHSRAGPGADSPAAGGATSTAGISSGHASFRGCPKNHETWRGVDVSAILISYKRVPSRCKKFAIRKDRADGQEVSPVEMTLLIGHGTSVAFPCHHAL